MRARLITATVIVLAMLGAGFGAVSWNASAAVGEPDDYGYVYTDSKAPEPSVSFDWIDIIGTGTYAPLSGDDSYGGPYPIGFNFSFYGQRFTMFNISTNGFITFGPLGSSYLGNYQIPYSGSPNNIIAAYWDDMVVDSNELIYQTIGVEPNRQFVLEWYNVNRYGYSSYPMTFEIILNETSGDIWLQYLSLSTYPFEGQSATVGIENADGTVGTQYCYNQYILEEGLAIRFSTLPVLIGPSQTEEGEPGETVSYDVTVRNLQPFSDCIDITYASVEGWTVSLYDSLMNPLTDTDTDGTPDTDTLAGYESFDMIVTVDIPPTVGVDHDETTLFATSSVDPLVDHSCSLNTWLQGAWLEPPHNDYGVDQDSDGLYDELVVDVSVSVMETGWYYLEGDLRTPSNLSITWESAGEYLYAGLNAMELRYYGWQIRNVGLDGPYTIFLYLYDDWYNILDTGMHTTFAYAYSDFAENPGLITGVSEEVGDDDADGLYDYLQINVDVDVNRAGRFVLSASLYDNDWLWLEDIEVDDAFTVGLHTVEFVFDPWTIRTQAVDGQFNFEVYLYSDIDGWLMYMDYEWYQTASYGASMFERPSAMFEAPHSDHGVDADGDLLWDFLVVGASVNVTEEGLYTVQGILTDIWGNQFDTVTVYVQLDEGLHTVELSFEGFPMRYSGVNGPYNVYLYVMGDFLMMDEDYHQTSAYTWDSFEEQPASFEPPHASSVIDMDGDMLYDYLVIEVEVNATVAGSYQLLAYLYDPGGWYIDDVSEMVHLDVGLNTVELAFIAWLVYDSWNSGNFTVELYLFDSDGRYLDYDLHETDIYSYSDFEGFPGELWTPIETYAVDDDHDSLYDRLQVNVSVEVYYAGTFYLRGILYDDSWWQVAFDGVWESLEEGTQIVYLNFPGWMIYAHGYDTTFWVELYLYDSEMNPLDSATIMASWYDHEEFEADRPVLESGLTESAPAIDGAIGVDEWSDAVLVDLVDEFAANEMPVALMVMNDGSMLYICYDAYGDMTEGWDDASSIAFDTDNDRLETDGADDEFAMATQTIGTTIHMVYDDGSWNWVEDCAPFAHEGLSGAFGFAASPGHEVEHRIYEYAIPLSLLGVSPGDTLGLLGGSHECPGVYDSHFGYEIWWPGVTNWGVDMDLYGDLLLAEPVIVPPPTTTAVASGTAGTNGWFISGVNVTLSATGGDGGVDYTEYRIDGGSWTTYSSPVMFNADGTHSLEYRSVDNAAQVEATKTIAVKIDRVAPVTVSTVSSPYVWLNMTDATSGPGSTKYRVDGGAWQTYSGMVNISGEGTHTVEFYSVDAAGNAEEAQSLEVEVEDGQGGAILGDWTLWMVIAIIAIIAIISIGAIFGMRRKAKDAETKHVIKDIGSPVMQMQEYSSPPQKQEPPKPPEGK